MALQAGEMLRIPTTLLLGLLLLPMADSPPAAAQPAKTSPDSALPVVVAVDGRDCRRLMAQRNILVPHQPAPDVHYQPGRDVDSQGRPIAPADLPGGMPPLFEGMIELPVVIPLSELPGPTRSPSIGVSELPVAKLQIDPMTGRFALNGKPVQTSTEDALAVACRDYLAKQPAR